MKAIVIQAFLDRRTGVVHKAGDTIDVTAERYAEINATARGDMIKPVGKVAKKKG